MIARALALGAQLVLCMFVAAALSGCPSGARACSTNADCKAGEVCVFVDGAGTCGTPAEQTDDDDAGPNEDDAGPGDAGPDDDAGPPDDDAGPGDPDAGPDAGPEPADAGPHDYALTASPAVGASNAANGTRRLRARVRAAEVAEPMQGGTRRLGPPRR